MKKYIILHDEKNYNNVSDLIRFFKNEFSAPQKAMNTHMLCSKPFGFKRYTVMIDDGKMRIYEGNFNENGDFYLSIKFTINIKNFATWGDFEKYLRRQ